MSGINEPLQIVGMAIATIGSKGQYTVVSPVARSGKIRDWHQLHGGDPQSYQVVESFLQRREGSLRSESTNMEFVNDGFLPRPSAPFLIGPFESRGIDYRTWAMHVRRLKSRRWIWHLGVAINFKLILSGWRGGGNEFKPTIS